MMLPPKAPARLVLSQNREVRIRLRNSAGSASSTSATSVTKPSRSIAANLSAKFSFAATAPDRQCAGSLSRVTTTSERKELRLASRHVPL